MQEPEKPWRLGPPKGAARGSPMVESEVTQEEVWSAVTYVTPVVSKYAHIGRICSQDSDHT